MKAAAQSGRSSKTREEREMRWGQMRKATEDNKKTVKDLLAELNLDETIEETGTSLAGMTFVITGSLNHFENRDALKKEIENAGGKVAGSVSAKTSYLINNDVASTSGKNKKAKELGIPIIDEDKIIEMLEM